VLGGERFKEAIAGLVQRRVQPLPKGRPVRGDGESVLLESSSGDVDFSNRPVP
jgi:hypothetical protein